MNKVKKKKLFVVASLFVLCSCVNDSTKLNNDTQQDKTQYSNTAYSNENTNVTKNHENQESIDDWYRKASIISQDIVQEKIGKCDFEKLNYVGETTLVENRYKILQKFTHKGEQYVYRIYIQYNGGEWTNRDNWSYGELTIENSSTGKQLRYDGTMKSEEKVSSGMITAGGVDFKIAEKIGTTIRIYSDKKLSLNEIKKVVKDLYKQYDIIHFAVYPRIERGDEYCTYQMKMIFDYDKDDVIGFNPEKD